jgi:hypothetical protein
MKRFFSFLPLFAILLCAGVLSAEAAAATSEPASSDWITAAAVLCARILPIIAVPLILIATWAAGKLAVKLHLDGIINTHAIIESAVQKGVDYAEQWAQKQAAAPIGSDKMKVAVNFADQILQNAAVKTYATEHLEKIAEGIVGQRNAAAEDTTK